MCSCWTPPLIVRNWLRKCVFRAFNLRSYPASSVILLLPTMLVDWNPRLPNSTHHSYWKGPVVFLSWPGCRRAVKRWGVKEGKKTDDPHYLLQGGERERCVCWVIHRLTLSFPGFLPSSFVCSLNPLITKSFLVQCWCLLGNCQTRVWSLRLFSAPIQQTFTEEHCRFWVV